MRAFCTVSAPLEVCASSAEQLSPGSRFLALRLLGNQQQPKTLYFLVDAKSRVRELYTQTCLHFATQGMLDTELFGLAVLVDGEYMFADPESKLSKYGPKSWRSSHTHGLDANGRPLLELHFRVQFYIESPLLLKDESSRHHYYLQLKHNTLQRAPARARLDQSLLLLAGLALQADLGDAPPEQQQQQPTDIASTTSTSSPPLSSSSSTAVGGDVSNKIKSTITATTTTTLPKINKRIIGGDRLLRLSTHTGKNITTTASATTTTTATAIATNGADDYFRLEDYLPTAALHATWAASAVRACHRERRGMSTGDAELLYIQQACALDDTINAHTFRMRLAKSEQGAGSAWFVVYAKGIKILLTDREKEREREEHTVFLWPNITKLSFERKKFEIRCGENRITLYAVSDEKNKMLLTLCKETHQFSMKLAARLKEVSKREEEEANCLHASYAYSRSLLMLPYKSKNEQRISVISSTSSNTTSGIVSDRVHSEDELEIMINTPPAPIAAPSTESLALAHLLDRPIASVSANASTNVSRQTSSVGQVSLEQQLAALAVTTTATGGGAAAAAAMPSTTTMTNSSSSPVELNSPQASGNMGSAMMVVTAATDSPSSQHAIGSQCSSTCSTVVVSSPTAMALNGAHSASSSLELGYSHTAQNSALSEAPSTTSYTLAPPTETSGVYTMHSSELTGRSSEMAESEKSSHYDAFPPAKSIQDVVTTKLPNSSSASNSKLGLKPSSFRLRSDSNVSTSSSFRGDGSDPTDTQHTLLSAEELSNLIVGRGTYPSRVTVSSTLHSDCDYVELQGAGRAAEQPPPPPPPYSARHEKTGLCGPPIVPKTPKIPKSQLSQPTKSSSECVVVSGKAAVHAPRRMDPPPYPSSHHKPRPSSLISVTSSAAAAAQLPPPPTMSGVAGGSMTSLKSEEVTARFITTRPQINILKAHTSLVGDGAKAPSYAAPTTCSSAASSSAGSICSHHLSQQSVHNANYVSGGSLGHHHAHHSHHSHHPHHHTGSASIGIPIVPYGLHKSSASHAELKPPTCVLLPVIKPRQFLPPPPPSLPRQPPPPPPSASAHHHHHHHHHLASLYSSQQLARKQLELYQQQLYSDVDYVIYPLQDPAVSQQEYLDAKQSSLLAAMAAQAPAPVPPPSYLAYPTAAGGWETCKGHAIYRSTPYLPLALSAHSRYASTQNLSDTYVQLPAAAAAAAAYSPIYSPSMASLCSSYEPPPPPPLHPAALAAVSSQNLFARSRSRSDDNILNSLDALPKAKRLPPPPPPPPPYVNRRLKKPPMPVPSEKPPPIPSKPSCVLPPRKPPTINPHHANSPITKTSSGAQWAGERPKPDLGLNRGGNSILAQLQASMAASHSSPPSASMRSHQQPSQLLPPPPNALDIALLREKSKHLDLPLISALCNDRSLLKQTKVITPTLPSSNSQPQINATNNNNDGSQLAATASAASTTTAITTSTVAATNSNNSSSSSPLSKNVTTLSKSRKSSTTIGSHRHPNDKLPPLPVQQLAEANNYVMDPAVVLKHHHKSYNSPT